MNGDEVNFDDLLCEAQAVSISTLVQEVLKFVTKHGSYSPK